MHSTLFSTTCHSITASYSCTAHHITQHKVPLKNTNLSLYCTLHYSAHHVTLAQQSIAVFHTTLFSRLCQSSTAYYRFTSHHIIQQEVPLHHSKLSLYCTPHYLAERAPLAQQSIAVLHTTLFSTRCNCNTAIYRCTTHHII